MRVFINTWFGRYAKREKISSKKLIKAIEGAEKGIVDVDLGGNVIKQRIARSGQGKSGGYRTIIVFKKNDKAFFLFGFAKNDRENIAKNELIFFKETAKGLLALSDEQIDKLIEAGALTEITT